MSENCVNLRFPGAETIQSRYDYFSVLVILIAQQWLDPVGMILIEPMLPDQLLFIDAKEGLSAYNHGGVFCVDLIKGAVEDYE
jgi:hypothetical protein